MQLATSLRSGETSIRKSSKCLQAWTGELPTHETPYAPHLTYLAMVCTLPRPTNNGTFKAVVTNNSRGYCSKHERFYPSFTSPTSSSQCVYWDRSPRCSFVTLNPCAHMPHSSTSTTPTVCTISLPLGSLACSSRYMQERIIEEMIPAVYMA